MKIAVSLVVDLDPAQWAEVFGIDKSGVREDVREYILNLVRDAEVFSDATIVKK